MRFVSPFDVPKQGGSKALLDKLESCMRWGLAAREPYELRALQSFFFWAGDHWSSVDSDITRRIGRKIERPPYCESKVTDNQLPIYVRQVISTCTDALSDYEAIPATKDEQDQGAADLATRILRMRARVDDEEQLREDELLWLFGSGEVLRRTWYNPRKRSHDGAMGDIDTEVVNLFRYAKCPEDSIWPPRWLIEMDARHVDWVRSNYGTTVEPEDLADVMTNIDALSQNIVSQRRPSREERGSSIILKRLYSPPCEKYPDGHVWVWGGGKVLKHHDLQIPGVFPFSRAYWYQVPGRLYPLSYLEPLLSDQRQLDVLLSQLQEVKNRQLRGDVITRGASGQVTTRVLDAKTGQREIRLGAGVDQFEFLTYDLNIQTAQADYERLLRNLHDKAGLSQPTLGQVTARKTTATELQLLREAGFQNISYHLRNFDRHQCRISKHKILTAQSFFQAARLLVEHGTASQWGMGYFFGADLAGFHDVVSVPTPRMTPAMKRQALQEAAERGLFGPWLGPDGLPDPRIEYAARTQLRMMGLSEEEERLGQTFLTYEELEKLVGQVHRMGIEAWLQRAAAAVGMLPPGAAGPMQMAPGMLPPEAMGAGPGAPPEALAAQEAPAETPTDFIIQQ